MKYEQIVEELKKLNPDAIIMTADFRMTYKIYSSVPGPKLRLPKGFEYNEKNGITNKHITENGEYITIQVEPIEKIDAIPVKEEDKKEEQKDSEDMETFLRKEKEKIFDEEALRKINQNPNAVIDADGKAMTYSSIFCANPTKRFTYEEISILIVMMNRGTLKIDELRSKYGFTSFGQLQAAFSDISKQAAVDYINANVNAVTPIRSSRARLRSSSAVNSRIVNWFSKFENSLNKFRKKTNPVHLSNLHREFRNNPGNFIRNANTYAKGNTISIVKDVSQSTNINEIVEVIKTLNPGANIRLGNPNVDASARDRFYSSIPMDKLVLPKGFEYNEKNGITNKHHTESGAYTSLTAVPLNGVNPAMLMPEKMNVVKNERPALSKIRKVRNVAVSAVKKLHSKVQTKMHSKGEKKNARNR